MAERSIVQEQRDVVGAVQQVSDQYLQEELEADARLKMDRDSAEQSLSQVREGADGELRRALGLLQECERLLQPRGVAKSLGDVVPLPPPRLFEGDLLLGLRICVTQIEARVMRIKASFGDDSSSSMITAGLVLGGVVAVGAIFLLPFATAGSSPAGSGWSMGWFLAMLSPFVIALLAAAARATVLRPYSPESDYAFIREQMAYVLYMHQVLMEEAHSTYERRLGERQARLEETKEKLTQVFRQQLALLEPVVARFSARASALAPEWSASSWSTWQPSTRRPSATCIGELLAGVREDRVALPALIPFPGDESVIIKTEENGREPALAAIRSILLRLVATVPPGELRLTLIDPRGQGQNVSDFLFFADQGLSIGLSNGRAWTEPQQIEQRLHELAALVEGASQGQTLGFKSPRIQLDDPSNKAPEPLRVLVVLDFPTSFGGTTSRLLTNLLQHGPKAGIHPIVHIDMDETLPYGFNLADVEVAATTIGWDGRRFVWQDKDFRQCWLELDAMPRGPLAKRILDGALEPVRHVAPIVKPKAS